MRISNARMAWGWSIMTGSLLLKVGAARFVAKLQQKKASLSQWITTIPQWKFAGCYVLDAIIVSLVAIVLGLTVHGY